MYIVLAPFLLSFAIIYIYLYFILCSVFVIFSYMYSYGHIEYFAYIVVVLGNSRIMIMQSEYVPSALMNINKRN